MASLADLDPDTLADIRAVTDWAMRSTFHGGPCRDCAERLAALLPSERMEPVPFLRWLGGTVQPLGTGGVGGPAMLSSGLLAEIAARWPKEAL